MQIKTSWDLSDLKDNLSEVETESYKFINKWKDRSDYLEDAKVLRQALDEYEYWQKNWGKDGDAGYKIVMQTCLDKNDTELKAQWNKITDFGNKIDNDIQFFELRIAQIDTDKQHIFLNHTDLHKYKHFLHRLFESAKYQLSEPEEKIMTLKSAVSHSNWTRMTSGFLAKEERDGKSFAEIMSLMNDKNKKIRDKAAKHFNEILAKHADVAESEMNSILQNKKISDELRGFARPDSARHLSDDIETEVVDALVTAVSSRFDIAQKYYKLKAKMLGVKKLKYHERNVEIGKINKKFTYEQGFDLVQEVFLKLDPEFKINFQIDAFPKKGKSSGAACYHNLLSQPTFVYLNHTDKLNDVLTLAHECGHGINNELMKKKQHALYFGTPLCTAEVASTFMEDFVLQELKAPALLMQKLNDDISTIFRQVAFYKFETELHQEFRKVGYLPKEKIGQIFQKHMISYMGNAVEQSRGSQNWWIYVSHFRNFFYVYSYASGLLISKSLQAFVKQDPKFINKVKDFLSAGTSDSPKNIFAKLGIDITDPKFWHQGLQEISSSFPDL